MSTGLTWVTCAYMSNDDAAGSIPRTQYIQSFNDYDEAYAFIVWNINAMIDSGLDVPDDVFWYIYTASPNMNGYFRYNAPDVEFSQYQYYL